MALLQRVKSKLMHAALILSIGLMIYLGIGRFILTHTPLSGYLTRTLASSSPIGSIGDTSDETRMAGKAVSSKKPATFPVISAFQSNVSKVTTERSRVLWAVTPPPSIRDNCTAEFKSRHLVSSFIGGRTGNKLINLAVLIAAADDACYTAIVDNGKIPYIYPMLKRIDNVVVMNVNRSKFKIVREGKTQAYNGPIWRTLVSKPDSNWTIVRIRQSYKYFQHKKELVRSSFHFNDDVKTDVAKYLTNQTLYDKVKVGIHIRRGDFLVQRIVDKGMFASDVDYIYRAVEYFKQHQPAENLVFIVVSEDIKWCRDNLRITNAYFSPFKDWGRDFYLFTQCDHSIVTTGTFGWMGAWLNETGTVVYDKSFPRNGSIIWKLYVKDDYYPFWWIGL